MSGLGNNGRYKNFERRANGDITGMRRLKSRYALGVADPRVGQHFDCNFAFQMEIARQIHLPHPPAPNGSTISYAPSFVPFVNVMNGIWVSLTAVCSFAGA